MADKLVELASEDAAVVGAAASSFSTPGPEDGGSDAVGLLDDETDAESAEA